MAAMVCQRHKVPVEMMRVVNDASTPQFPAGSATARCSRCSKNVDCAYCPKCNNTICVACYNKSIDQKGQPPRLGPSLVD
jgi:hypothetical protein